MKKQIKAVKLDELTLYSISQGIMIDPSPKALVKFSDLEACPDVPDCKKCKEALMNEIEESQCSGVVAMDTIETLIDNMPEEKDE